MFGYWRFFQSSPNLPISFRDDYCHTTDATTPGASSARSLARSSLSEEKSRSLAKPPSKPSKAQFLPPELLFHIFQYLPRSRAPDRDTIVYPALIQPDRNPTDELYNLTIVCRQWNSPATCVLYKYVDVSSVRATTKLARTLQITISSSLYSWQNEADAQFVPLSGAAKSRSMSPSRLGTLIRTLRIPMRANCQDVPQLPYDLQTLFQEIVSSCPNLESLECSASIRNSKIGETNSDARADDSDPSSTTSHFVAERIWTPTTLNPSKITVLYLSNTSLPIAFEPSVLIPFTRLKTLTLAGFHIDHVPTPTTNEEASSSSSSSSISCVETLVLAHCYVTNLSALFPPTDSEIKLRHLELHRCNVHEIHRITIPLHLHKRLETFVDYHSNLDLGVIQHLTNLTMLHVPGERFWYARAMFPPNITHVSLSLLNVGDGFARMSNVMLLLDGMKDKLMNVEKISAFVNQRSDWFELEEETREELQKRGVEFDVHAVSRAQFPGFKFQRPQSKTWREYLFGRSIEATLQVWDQCSAEHGL